MHFYLLNHEVTYEDIKKFNYPNKKIGVIAYIENSNKEILLQQRGKKARDENGLFETIGGKVDKEDINFKSAIFREIREETGDEVNLVFEKSLGIYHCQKKDINWIFIIYFIKYIDGNIKIMEPDKCIGYKFFEYDEAMKSDLVAYNCKYLIKQIRKNI